MVASRGVSLALLAGIAWICAAMFQQTLSGRAANSECRGIEIEAGGAKRCVPIGDGFKECDLCPEMIVVPPGSFEMGSAEDEAGHTPSEAPRHQVRIGAALAVSKFEATFGEWDACVAGGGCKHQPRDPGWGRGRRPVVNVSWDDIANEYIPWLSRKAGHGYRLLTEAEWEYVARAGSPGPFSTGSAISTVQANFDGTSTYGDAEKGEYRKRTMEAGSFAPNAFGLFDLHGNVWEWVQDCYAATYVTAPSDGSSVTEIAGCQRVMRGGSWIDSPRVLRSAARGHVPSNTRFIYRGFRVVRSA